jgi:blue copper oxidase
VLRYRAEVVEGDPASVAESGSYLGPTLHLREGQRVRVRFENRLDQESIVHWHGLVVPQGQDGQPPEAVGPGAAYDYDFVVENAPGTYWYHPHPHGLTGEQVYRGLAGLLVVHGDESSALTAAVDLPLVLQDRTIGADGQLRYVRQMSERMMGFVGATLVTNGVADYTVTVARRPHRLRLLNGANSRTQLLTMSTGDALAVVATDGHLLAQTAMVDRLVLTPAQRSDVWIDFSRFEPGQRVQLLSADLFVESGAFMGAGSGAGPGAGMGGMGAAAPLQLEPIVAATFVIAGGDAAPGIAPTALAAVPTLSEADASNPASPKEFVLTSRQAAHWINGLQWQERQVTPLETVEAGGVEVWEFVNRSPMPHPMHVHGRAFRVVRRTWDDDSLAAAWRTVEAGVIETGWRDTVLVWPGQRVRLVVPFAKHEGYFLYHCHVLEHEDAGMMRSFRAVRR